MSAIKRDIGVKIVGNYYQDMADSLTGLTHYFHRSGIFLFYSLLLLLKENEKMENSRIHGEHFFTSSDNTRCFIGTGPLYSPGLKRSSSFSSRS